MTERKPHVKLITGLVAFGMIVLASGSAPQAQTTSPFASQNTRLAVGLSKSSNAADQSKKPKEINGVIASQPDLRKALGALRTPGASPAPPKLKDLIELIELENKSAPNGLVAFRSLGGGYTRALISGAHGKVGSNDDYDQSKDVSVTLSGLITGYSFNLANRTGSLLVETTAVTTVDGVEIESVDYVWNVQIKAPGYEVHFHSGDATDPFPGTLAFGQSMLDRIADKGFNTKLWAAGAGAIKILSVTINGTPVDPDDPLLRSDPDNCIDMMFALPDNDGDGVPDEDSIPTNIAELQEHSYCLGRCKNPAIVNSK